MTTRLDLSQPCHVDPASHQVQGGCCFCGRQIHHVNDGGEGWILTAQKDQGEAQDYLYCVACSAARQHEIHRCYNQDQKPGWKLDPHHTYDACDDFAYYLEFLGDRCPDCQGTPEEVDARLYDPAWALWRKGPQTSK